MEKDNLQNTNTTNNLIFTNIFNFRNCSDAKGCQMTSSIEPLEVTPSTSPSLHTNMASSDFAHISTTSGTPPSHLAILSIKGFVVPSDNYSDISRQVLASESPIKIVCFIIKDIWRRCSFQWLESYLSVSVGRNRSFRDGVEKWCNEVGKQFQKVFQSFQQ